MRRIRAPYVVAFAVITALTSATPAGAAPSAPATAAEYVVAFAAGSPAAALDAIRAAGGTVVDVNEEIGLAKVSSTSTGFLTSVRTKAGVSGAARNHSVGTAAPGAPHRVAERPAGAEKAVGARAGVRNRPGKRTAEPLADRQWDMDLIGTDAAHRVATGKGVDVGIIDTGIDGTHPDVAPNFDAARSRNFTIDIPAIDGPCEVSTCIDPANVDDDGHGTHVAGTIAAAANRFGIEGVAPDARLVNLRAGQDSGFFFLYETVAALVEAGDLRLDVVNMSFYTDPWLYNCASRADYVSGDVSDEELAEQALVRELVQNAVAYAHDRGVTLVAAAGNEHLDASLPTRTDASSPDYPDGAAHDRVVTKNCLDLPAEAPGVISVSSVGPSGTKSDFSNYGLGEVDVAAPGGWFRDFVGTPAYQTPGNLVLSSYPLGAAITQGLADANGDPVDDFSVKYCNDRGVCGFYTYLQGTSMASPHAAGVAALIVDRFGRRTKGGGKSLAPDTVARILEASATDHACPAGGTEIYTDEGRTPDFNAICQGTTAVNGLYGEGIVNAARAVARR